mmetsp:Transcript_21866/g.67296  ORF Transcript_21866/g.67296 Transcript_21866/m.67296 type:complete len:303 (+) Transcript_21866:41-949(+)
MKGSEASVETAAYVATPRKAKDVVYHGKPVFESSAGEASSIAHQVRGYFEHGLVLTEEMTVIDAGAHIGLFALEILERCRGARVFCCEPIPSTAALLRLNVARFSEREQPVVLNCGLGATSSVETFFYNPMASMTSTAYPDVFDPVDVESYVSWFRSSDCPKAYLTAFPVHPKYIPRHVLRHFMVKAMKPKRLPPVRCEVRTLQEVIAAHSIQEIGLLKVDVEGAEEDVINGLSEDDWGKIQAVVVEVHDNVEGRFSRVLEKCLGHGLMHYAEVVEPEFARVNMPMKTLVAARYPLRKEQQG